MTPKENLETLLAAVKAFPESRLNLARFAVEHPCGTIYCIAGIAQTVPELVAEIRHPEILSETDKAETLAWDDRMWGGDRHSFYRLFCVRGASEYDETLPKAATDKEIAIHRLECALKELK